MRKKGKDKENDGTSSSQIYNRMMIFKISSESEHMRLRSFLMNILSEFAIREKHSQSEYDIWYIQYTICNMVYGIYNIQYGIWYMVYRIYKSSKLLS